MVKFYTTNYTYDFPLPTVSLAYFLRYPNPYSKHVVSSDVIERRFDPITQRLYTTRLHLKQSRLPSAVVRLLPRSILGSREQRSGESQSYILETSTVDVKDGWMVTESRNLDWRGVLSVTERQVYTPARDAAASDCTGDVRMPLASDSRTNVETTVTLRSPLGEQKWKQRRSKDFGATSSSSSLDDDAPPKMGFFRSWGTQSVQRSIEMIGLRRTEKSQPNAKEGMKVVLERFRKGGLVGVLEGMRQDRPDMFAPPKPGDGDSGFI